MISKYLKTVENQYNSQNATEHSYRGALQNLLSSIIDDEKITVVNEPKRSECGAPDYIISKKIKGQNSNSIPLGFIEAKDIGKDLKSKNYKEQFDRYKKGLENLIITDYLTFEFYKKDDHSKATLYETCTIAELVDGKIKPLKDEFGKFNNLIRDFVTFVGQTIKSPSNLAAMMAGKAKMLADVIKRAIESDEENLANSSLKDQMQAFKKILIHDISPPEFADVYAQTITYGMFAARLHDKTLEDFSRQEAATLIPKTNPFLRNLFQYVSGYDVDDRIVWIVDSLADIFVYTDINQLLKNFGKATKTHDPIIHFYETFLSEYDPKLRKARGVWYTPEPVVNFIVRAVNDILKTEFGLPDGLADTSKTTIKIPVQGSKKLRDKEVHKVQILDPATGTGTFLAEVIKHIHKKFTGMEGIWSDYVEKDLMPRLNGFEILMASYAMAHLKLELLLKETGYQPVKPDRFHVYLTNSLEEAHPDTGTLFASWLSNEATAANLVKMEAPVMVVLGNPPYSVSSSNKGEWIQNLLKDYKKDLNERNIQPLSDDYIKFIRYGQHYIEKNGEGILAYISNNSFIDGIIHRQMRKYLLESFDKVYILDLHGNSKKKEIAPDGGKDENVFDIMQGVSINIFVKTGKKKKNKLGQLRHHDMFGRRDKKYEFLNGNSLASIKWNELENRKPEFFFVKKDFEVEGEYVKGFSIVSLMKNLNPGVETGRDDFFMGFQEESLKLKTEKVFNNKSSSDLKLKYKIKDTSSFRFKSNLKAALYNVNNIKKISYRPFDIRFTYYDRKLQRRASYETFKHIINGSIGLVIKRGFSEVNSAPVFIVNNISDRRGWTRAGMQGAESITPLYLYPDQETDNLDLPRFNEKDRTPNLNMEIVDELAQKLGLEFVSEKISETSPTSPDEGLSEGEVFAPIDILDYIYAVLHSPTYREKYKEFLKIDFPRVPFPKDKNKFWKLVRLGKEIRELHLLESTKLNDIIATYPKSGNNEITRSLNKKDWELYDDKKSLGRIWINDTQYFDKIPLIAWEFYIGGYQPAQKWLKDRRKRTLSLNDIRHYLKIIVALVETDRLMKEIDKVGIV